MHIVSNEHDSSAITVFNGARKINKNKCIINRLLFIVRIKN